MTTVSTKYFRFCAIVFASCFLLGPVQTSVDAFSVDVVTTSKASLCWQGIRNKRYYPDSELVLLAQNGDVEDDKDEPGIMANLMKDTQDLTVGDWVVAKRDLPSLGIRSGAVYKIQSIFLKGTAAPESTGLGVEVIPLETYGDETPSAGYTKYLEVYNPRDHDKLEDMGVVVTPEEIGLVSVKADWTEALFLAVPGFFWVFVAMAFSNYYTDRYGGSFFDAFFRT